MALMGALFIIKLRLLGVTSLIELSEELVISQEAITSHKARLLFRRKTFLEAIVGKDVEKSDSIMGQNRF